MNITLNSFREAAGLTQTAAGEGKEASTRIQLADGGAQANREMRVRFYAALASESGISSDYLAQVRSSLGLENLSGEQASRPLEAREVRSIIETAETICRQEAINLTVLVQKMLTLADRSAESILSIGIDQATESFKRFLATLPEMRGIDEARTSALAYFEAQATAKLQEYARSCLNDCTEALKQASAQGTVSSARKSVIVAEYLISVQRYVDDLRMLVQSALQDPSFDFTAVEWPKPVKVVFLDQVLRQIKAAIEKLVSAKESDEKAMEREAAAAEVPTGPEAVPAASRRVQLLAELDAVELDHLAEKTSEDRRLELDKELMNLIAGYERRLNNRLDIA